MSDLLTGDKVSPRNSVIGRSVEVSIIKLDRALSDVTAARPDLRYAEPAVIAVSRIADFYPSGEVLTAVLNSRK